MSRLPVPRYAMLVMTEHGRQRLLISALVMLLFISILVATGLGSVAISPDLTARILLAHLLHHNDIAAASQTGSTAQDSIVWLIRAPRVLLAGIVGASLAMVGVALQAVTSNRLADPHLLGVSSGATLGAVAATLFLGAAFGPFTLSLVAFAGALAATALVIVLAYRRGRLESDRLLLSGVAVSFVMMAAANLLLFMGDQRAASSVLFWTLGGVGLARWDMLGIPALFAALGGLLLAGRHRQLNALATGDLAAASLGISIAAMRCEVFAVGALVTGAMVAVSGAIGFVGLVTPHLCRALVGADHARLLPVSALAGAILLIWADVAARMLIAPEDLPIGIVTALIGGFFFVVLMRRR
jgi:iron complex transport system permease protein